MTVNTPYFQASYIVIFQIIIQYFVRLIIFILMAVMCLLKAFTETNQIFLLMLYSNYTTPHYIPISYKDSPFGDPLIKHTKQGLVLFKLELSNLLVMVTYEAVPTYFTQN